MTVIGKEPKNDRAALLRRFFSLTPIRIPMRRAECGANAQSFIGIAEGVRPNAADRDKPQREVENGMYLRERIGILT